MKRLNYSSATMEEFAIRTISESFDKIYSTYVWHDKDDNFDFSSLDNVVAIEVATILSNNIINAIQYENALNNGKTPDINKVINSQIDKEGKLITYYGGLMDEIRDIIINIINKKERKRIKRIRKYWSYELCLCVNEGGLFNTPRDFEFIVDNGILCITEFSRLFIANFKIHHWV